MWTQAEADKPDAPEWAWAKSVGLNIQPGRYGNGLGKTVMHYGGNSGYQAINMAYLMGATRIILLGYDMQCTGGKAHFFGDHPGKLRTGTDYTGWVPQFVPLARDLEREGVEVINCSPSTALTAFPRGVL